VRRAAAEGAGIVLLQELLATAYFCPGQKAAHFALAQGAARAHEIVGVDLVEVAPDYDPSGTTQILAAQVLMDFLGFIFHAGGGRGWRTALQGFSS